MSNQALGKKVEDMSKQAFSSCVSKEVVGRSNADNHVESLKQALANINLADLTQDELRDLLNNLLKSREKLVRRAEVLRGTGGKSKSILRD